jgi:amino acid transporter
MTASAPVPDDHGGMLRRELRFWEAIALSIAIMAPTAAMALNGTVPASLVGRAVPLAFIFATIGVIFVSWAFIRLTSNFSHAGSVLVVGLAITVVVPGLTRNIGARLAAREGLPREA